MVLVVEQQQQQQEEEEEGQGGSNYSSPFIKRERVRTACLKPSLQQ
jgi:hypothetical protein